MDVFIAAASIFMSLCSALGIVCALIFVTVLLIDRQCRLMTSILVLNSLVAGFTVNVVYMCQSVYQLTNNEEDPLCVFRGFLTHCTCGFLYHTFCVQALHRLFVTIPIRQECIRLKRATKLVIVIQWIVSFTFALPIVLNGRIKYQTGSRICQVSITDVYGFLYLAGWIYIAPLFLIIAIYVRVLTYIQPTTISGTTRPSSSERQRELCIFRRIIIPVVVLFIMGFPYLLLFLIFQFSHLTVSPYTQTICFIFISFGQGMSMLLLLINTDDVRKYLINAFRRLKRRRRRRRQRRAPCISFIHLPLRIVPLQMM